MSTRELISRRRFVNALGAAGGLVLTGFGSVADGASSPSVQSSTTASLRGGATRHSSSSDEELPLPTPNPEGQVSLERALSERRSVRQFSEEPLTWPQISQLLWAAQGITDPTGKRTAPSAGALYPLEFYVATAEGLYHYRPSGHVTIARSQEDLRPGLHNAALQQTAVLNAPVVFVVTAVYARTEAKYGRQRSPRYVHLEAGHAAQDILLQAVALGLAAVPIGAFHDEQVQAVLDLPEDHAPLYLIPVGHPLS